MHSLPLIRLIALAMVLSGLAGATVPAQVPGENDHLPGRTVRILTYNIQTCNLYDTSGTQIGSSCANVADVIREFSPDLVALQEVRNNSQASIIASGLGYNHYFGCATCFLGICTLGNAVLTPHAIQHSATHTLPRMEDAAQRVMVEVAVEIEGVPLTFYTCHLNFNSTADKRYQYLEMMNIIGEREGPRILVGDFNDQDDRPNSYSARGFTNIVTGAGHGTILPTEPKMFDVHRKVGHWTQVKNNPPYYSLRADWDPPMREANTISGWLPRVRIDYIFASPEFYLDAPHNTAWAVDTAEITERLYGQRYIVSDHRPVYAELLLPKPPIGLFLHPQDGPTVLTVGESRTIHAGGRDMASNPVSLLRTDPDAPRESFRRTNRMIQGVEWTFEGTGGHLGEVDVLAGYDPYIRHDRPSAAATRFIATEEGSGTLTARIDGVEASLDILVIPAGQEYIIEEPPPSGVDSWFVGEAAVPGASNFVALGGMEAAR